MSIGRRRVVGAVLAGAVLVALTLAYGSSDEAALAEELERAKSFFVHGSFPQAAVALGAVVAKLESEARGEPVRAMLADAHFHLGLTYFALSSTDSARDSFREVIRLDPEFAVDPERYAPRIVELYEEARRLAEEEPESGEVSAARPEEKGPGAERILLGAAAAAAGVGVGVAAAGGNETSASNAATPLDGDGDGVAATEGDCDDADPRVHPEGEVSLRVSYAFTGTVSCRTANPREQVYEVVNHSCSVFSFLDLQREVATTDSLGRRTAELGTSLPVDVHFVPPATTAVIRRGAPAGTSEALCRDLGLANPFSRPKGDLRVEETYVLRTAAGPEPRAFNSFLVLNTAECTFCSLDSIFGPYASRTPAFSFQSGLRVAGGTGRLVLDGEQVLSVDSGFLRLSANAELGKVLVEGQLLTAGGKPGFWRFDFSESPRFEPGTLTIHEGEADVLSATAVVFRLRGNPGERIAFAFRLVR